VNLPPELLQHTVPIEPWTGTDGYGRDTYGASFNLTCFKEDHRRLVRNDQGSEVLSETTLYANRGPSVPSRSRVTLPGRTSLVILVKDHDGTGLPVPSHLEIHCE